MNRRSVDGLLLIVLFVAALSVAAIAETEALLPNVVHLDSLMLSTDDQTALADQMEALESFLGEDLPITRKRAERLDWTEETLAILVAGLLSEGGFESAVVRGGEEPARTWTLVAIRVGDLAIWIPVDVVWGDRDEDRLGRIPWELDVEGARFDEAYLEITEVLALETNAPPVAAMRRSLDLYVKKTLLRFYADPSEDVDGELIVFAWSIDGGAPMTTTVPLLMHRFQRAGDYTISLTVMDDRGATATDEMKIVVLEEEPDCRACDPDA